MHMCRRTNRLPFLQIGHSWSSIALPNADGIVVNLDHINELLDVDYETLQVSVEAGIRLRALCELLWEAGLSLANHGVVSEQSLAGAMMTGTHGTGIGHLPIASQVVALDLLLANGTIVHLTKDGDHHHLFEASRLSLGAFGIVTAVRLQCVPRYQ
jgi:FAD/FMN-containing dehydrogenase